MEEKLTVAIQAADMLISDLFAIIKQANSPKPEGLSHGDRAIISMIGEAVTLTKQAREKLEIIR